MRDSDVLDCVVEERKTATTRRSRTRMICKEPEPNGKE
jgi:hypothetical protein